MFALTFSSLITLNDSALLPGLAWVICERVLADVLADDGLAHRPGCLHDGELALLHRHHQLPQIVGSGREPSADTLYQVALAAGRHGVINRDCFQ